ncbi:hypothetical protein [Streptomyces sp. JJ36]|uniref:hypothetical protein n=1 Tax=Streptomyces sp. JJ36 TaxID=2736645 RepID=UPI001F23178A|nr:hypothetical protein [Streptomyces sp. JJ36]MCF6526200.1 hypothetical protein [Streptomyces sp. JJ36]
MASHWRRAYRRKDGTWVRAHRVRGRDPQTGCAFWVLGLVVTVAALLLTVLG